MRIGFDLQLDEIPIFLELAKILHYEHGVEVSGVSLGKRYRDEIKKAPVHNHNISQFLKESFKASVSPSKLEDLTAKYGQFGLNRIIALDRFLSKKEYDELLKWIIGHLDFYDYYFTREQPDVLVSSGIAYLTQLAAYLVGKSKGIPYMGIMTTRIPNGRFVFCKDLRDNWDSVNRIYEYLNKSFTPASEHAKEFIKRFREQPSKPLYMNTIWQSCSIQSLHFKEFLNRSVSYYIKGWGWGRNRFDYYTFSPFYYALRELSKIINTNILKQANIFTEPELQQRFVLFPLHLQPETGINLQARFFVNQISTIENIAKCIPLNHLLYVKEHFSAFGRREKGFYKRLSEIRNVRLIHPNANTIELIKNARAIVTLASTVGWEALILKKPVLVLGDVFYTGSGLAIKVNSYEELESRLLEIVLGKNKETQPYDYDETLGRFVDAVFMGSYEGLFDLPLYNPGVLEPSNLRLLAKGLISDIKRLRDPAL